MNFTELNIISPILKALEKNNLIETTQIQEKVIPELLLRKNVIWLAKTWSWKTFSFLIPFLNNLYLYKKENNIVDSKQRELKFLIIAPTRELAIQIGDNVKIFANNLNLKYDVIFWWVNQFHQEKSINKGLDVIVATPWRLLDLTKQWIIKLDKINFLVLDEADKMLDMGFINDIEKILKYLKNLSQTALFSATMPDKINNLAMSFLTDPKIIKIWENGNTEAKIEQNYIEVENNNKLKAIKYLIKKNNWSTIIFVNTKDDCDIVYNKIKLMNFSADYIHRNRSQNARQKAITSIKNWDIKVLIATDIASRWIDINWLDLVINYNLPKEAETYIHRIGRTARAGKDWTAFSLVNQEEKFKLKIIENLIWKEIKKIITTEFLNEEIPKWEYLWNFWLNKEKKYYKKKK